MTLRLKMLPLLAVIVSVIGVMPVGAEPSSVDADYVKEASVTKEFVIVKSTHRYEEAHRAAVAASRRLGLRLDLRGLSPTATGRLTFPMEVCQADGLEASCYTPRGRFDDGVYVSIEHSSAYPEFAPSLFIVVLASGKKGSRDIKSVSARARHVFPDVYSRVADVYLGCMR